jgi:putative flavoprotein involved in K+ transport
MGCERTPVLPVFACGMREDTRLTRPCLCDATPRHRAGFDITRSLAGQLFEFTNGGMPNITENDESTAFTNIFLVGPHIAHGNAIFCFIYKYRQRFAVVVRELLKRLGCEEGADVIAEYAKKGFLLDDLSCCANTCEC